MFLEFHHFVLEELQKTSINVGKHKGQVVKEVLDLGKRNYLESLKDKLKELRIPLGEILERLLK